MEDVRPSSPQRLVFSMATLDIVDDDDGHLEFLPVVDHGIGREDIIEAEEKIAQRSTHGGYETDPVLIQENKRHHEMLEELVGIKHDELVVQGVVRVDPPFNNLPLPTSNPPNHIAQYNPGVITFVITEVTNKVTTQG